MSISVAGQLLGTPHSFFGRLNSLPSRIVVVFLSLLRTLLTALARFAGVARRYQYRGEAGGVTFVDDYAHLPTEVDAALNMELSLDCEARVGSVLCTPTKFDDLLRVLGGAPSVDRDWEFRFEDGLLREWTEQRPNAACCYEVEAIQPFLQWVRENRPEAPVLFPFEDGDWFIREGIAEEIAGFVAEWAASQGVVLDP